MEISNPIKSRAGLRHRGAKGTASKIAASECRSGGRATVALPPKWDCRKQLSWRPDEIEAGRDTRCNSVREREVTTVVEQAGADDHPIVERLSEVSLAQHCIACARCSSGTRQHDIGTRYCRGPNVRS
jgi:hypothetical protein